MLTKISKLAAVCVALAALAAAQQTSVRQENGDWVQEVTGSLAKASNLRIKTDMGSVRVTGGSQDAINYTVRNRVHGSSEETAKREFGSYKINAYVRGDTAWIVADWEGGRADRVNSDFVIAVPQSIAMVKVESGAGGVDISNISGQADAESGGGAIRLQNIGRQIDASTGGGNIEINGAGGDVHLETGGGNVHLGTIKGKVVATTGGGNMQLVSSTQDAVIETGGGSIHVQDCGGMLKVTTGGGDIDLGELNNGAVVETGGGSIHLSGAKGFVHIESGSGHIQLDGVPSARVETGAGAIVAKFIPSSGELHDSKLETSAGDITVYLSPAVHLAVDAAIEVANGHTIQSDFPELRISNDGGPWGSERAEGNLNGGGPALKIRTTSGNIVIRRSK
ncbi:MAG TPA: hypothetical protein VN684_09805 [Terriglobales bacterium]|nr:hypothetical protein [Terriglobales bacterium]